MHLILFDDHSWDNLLPLTFTRPISDLRVGILTISEKWEKELHSKSTPLTREYLRGKFSCQTGKDNLLINASLMPDDEMIRAVQELQDGQALSKEGTLLAVRTGTFQPEQFEPEQYLENSTVYPGEVSLVDFPWKIFSLNGQEIAADFTRITRGRKSEKLSETVRVIHSEKIFAEPGFQGEYITLNASHGPIYLGPDSEIMEGTHIRGPFALCEGSVVKLAAKIYGPTTIGPYSKVGGEINNSVIQANSNKAHDGFLGNSVIGEWCNLGADTNNSNLKNNYGEVKIWSYVKNGYIRTGRQYCGLIMADHSKCGINTMFNTGTVVGVSANIFGPGFPDNFVPSFSWGGAGGFTTYRMDKMMETAARVMERRDQYLSEEDIAILSYIFDNSVDLRKATGV
jgi:UDP-N-acetylglucosamine diphosphorylase/glucosamine-1-phosphate N-acetyltransferase